MCSCECVHMGSARGDFYSNNDNLVLSDCWKFPNRCNISKVVESRGVVIYTVPTKLYMNSMCESMPQVDKKNNI